MLEGVSRLLGDQDVKLQRRQLAGPRIIGTRCYNWASRTREPSGTASTRNREEIHLWDTSKMRSPHPTSGEIATKQIHPEGSFTMSLCDFSVRAAGALGAPGLLGKQNKREAVKKHTDHFVCMLAHLKTKGCNICMLFTTHALVH